MEDQSVLSYKELCNILCQIGLPVGSCDPRDKNKVRKQDLIKLAREHGVPYTKDKLSRTNSIIAQLNQLIDIDAKTTHQSGLSRRRSNDRKTATNPADLIVDDSMFASQQLDLPITNIDVSPPADTECSISSIADLINVNDNPLTVLSVYMACSTYGLPIRQGMELWLKLKRDHLDTLYKELGTTNLMRFLAQANYELTKVCQLPRQYEHDEFNFIKALIEGGCNCSCGTQMLWAIAEAYYLPNLGIALYPEHVNLLYQDVKNNNTMMVFETTRLNLASWTKLRDFSTGKRRHIMFYDKKTKLRRGDPQQILSIELSKLSKLLFPINEYFAYAPSELSMELMIDLYANTDKEFWSASSLLQLMWEQSRLSDSEAFSPQRQRYLIENIARYITESMDDTAIMSKMMYVVYHSPNLSKDISKFLAKILKIIEACLDDIYILPGKAERNYQQYGYVTRVQFNLDKYVNYLINNISCQSLFPFSQTGLYDQEYLHLAFNDLVNASISFQDTTTGERLGFESHFGKEFKWKIPLVQDAGVIDLFLLTADGCIFEFQHKWTQTEYRVVSFIHFESVKNPPEISSKLIE